MNILFTICGRAGSKGFKNKNLKEMNSVPLVYYTIAVIREYIDKHNEDNVRIAVNTDSEPLINLLKKIDYLPIEYVQRKAELAGDTVAKVDVIRDTFLTVDDQNTDVVIDLDITSPLRRLSDIENIIAEYQKNEYDVVFSVVEARRSPYFNMVESKEDGYYRKICVSNFVARQQAPKSYEMNASIYAYCPSFLIQKIEDTILDHKCGISIMPDYLVLDIDSEEDFRMMQYLHKCFCADDIELDRIYNRAKEMIVWEYM